MNLKTGQRYVGPGGAEMIVSKASGDGDLTDGDIELQIKGPNVNKRISAGQQRPTTRRK